MDQIQQGDQYVIPFDLNFDGKPISLEYDATDTTIKVDEIRIQIENILRTSSDDTPVEQRITYDNINQVWLFPIFEEETRNLPNKTQWQFAIRIGQSYYYSPVETLIIGRSIIKQAWGE